MSVSITYPTPVNTTRLKQFFWDVKDRRTVPRGIGGYYINDKPSTPYYTINTTATVVAQYTFTAGAGTNYIRVRVYGYVGSGTGYFSLIINGTTVAGPVSTTSTTNVLLIEYFGSLTPNTSYTVQVSAYVSGAGASANVSQVSINAGFGLTSTASTTILTINLDPANDTYTLYANGNFVYNVGVRWWAKGNRKTTATATIQSNLVSEIQSGTYSPTAADDTDNNAFIQLRTGNYATSFTISGNVGASGDVIIITEIYCQIVLRSNNQDSLNIFQYWLLLIKETGVVFLTERHATIDASNQTAEYVMMTKNGVIKPFFGASGSDVVISLNLTSNQSPECAWYVSPGEDVSFIPYFNIIIIGA